MLTARGSGQHDQAVEFAKQGIHQHPRSDWLWRELGNELTTLDCLDEAEKSLNTARSLNPNADWLWRYFAGLYRKRKHLDKEIEALETLNRLGVATGYDLNQLGIAYHNDRHFVKALKYYHLSAAAESDTSPWFNMGLVFNDPEVSQDLDATDAYRLALALKPDHERAKEQLEATKRKLVPLANQARADATGLVQEDKFFECYISPYEMLQIEAGESIEELDVKVIQRAKKRLEAEIEVNDGKVSWLEDYPLDKSHAYLGCE